MCKFIIVIRGENCWDTSASHHNGQGTVHVPSPPPPTGSSLKTDFLALSPPPKKKLIFFPSPNFIFLLMMHTWTIYWWKIPQFIYLFIYLSSSLNSFYADNFPDLFSLPFSLLWVSFVLVASSTLKIYRWGLRQFTFYSFLPFSGVFLGW